MMNQAVEHLMRLQSVDGGFGAYRGGNSRTEATALAALALHRSGDPGAEGAAEAAFAWLERYQLSSGAWPLEPDLPEPSWSTSLAVLACSHLAGGGPLVMAGGRWLLGQEGEGFPWWTRVLIRLFPQPRVVDLDASLAGWPWVEGTFSWVEPTSYAMMALVRLRSVITDRRLDDRLDEATRMLLDRVCVGGGWNYGNTRIFGDDLWPYPDTTSVALLAVADQAGLPAVADGLDALERMSRANDSVLSLALSALAFAAHGRDASASRARLSINVENWEDGEMRALAWAALALAEVDDVLGVRGG